MQLQHLVLAAIASAAVAQSPQSAVIPANYATNDAASFVWVPGACDDLRHQTLVGASHLTSLVGHAITALEFRRTAANEVYAGGAADLAVTLSTAPHGPLDCSEFYAANIGANAQQVFVGQVVIPTSPAIPGPVVAWTANNVIRIAFQQPFLYQGGTLCIDITGTMAAGQVADWWMADAAFDNTSGTAVDIGPGCGPHANSLGQWSFVSPRTLLPGANAEMEAYGPPGNWVVTAVGPAGPAVPLSLLNLGQPGCYAYLSDMYFLSIGQFVASTDPLLQSRGGLAEYRPHVPNAAWVLGVQLTTQWLDLVALHSSNAVTWTIAASMPTLDMALVDGVAGDTTGNVTSYLAHVLRFEYQ